jgi:hypothetical protein
MVMDTVYYREYDIIVDAASPCTLRVDPLIIATPAMTCFGSLAASLTIHENIWYHSNVPYNLGGNGRR